ncbi:MAG: hypothetical protein HY290_33825, partial [Planctomycetia bacterium]|nr:hypothetical protein [Planctomycetia bacterium]
MMRPAFRIRFAAAVALVCLAGSPLAWAREESGENSVGSTPVPQLRRIYVPADRPEAWPKGEWHPIPLSSLASRMDEIRAARSRPQPFLEHAEYTAKFNGGELHEGRLEWSIRRPDGPARMLPLGEFNLNVAGLTWATSTADGSRKPVVWGTNPRGAASLLVDRSQGRVDGQWSLDGRILAAGTEFDFVLAPATTTRLRITVPAGMVVSTSQGEAPRPLPGPEPGWTEWQVWLGSRTHVRLRIEPSADPAAARPLNVARTSISYSVRSEAVRLFAEFDLDVLESSLREVRILIDPDVQVTSIEYGDGGVVSWRLQTGEQGTVVIVQLPNSLSGDGPALQIQAISQIKQFGAWTLPRLRLENFLESDSRVTLLLQSSVNAADIRSDGYRQLSLTTGAEGEEMLFRQLRPGAAITIVPAEAHSDQACRAVSLIQPDRTQWTLTSQLEWSASAGGTYSAACRIPQLWDIVDVRSAFDQTTGGELTGWDVEDTDGGQRVLHVHFRNALNADRPQRLRVTARRLPPAVGEPIVVPPLVPVDAADVEHFTVVSTGSESRPVLQAGSTLEQVSVRNLPADIRSLDFLAHRLADRRGRNLAVRTLGANAAPGIRIETALADTVTRVAGNGGDDNSKPVAIPAHDRRSGFTSGFVPATLGVTARISGSSPGFDEYQARFHVAEWDAAHPIRFSLAPPAELVAASSRGRPLFAEFHDRACTLARPADSEAAQDGSATVEIEYRVPSALHAGPNSHRLILPVPDGAVVRCDLSLVIPDHLRLAEQPASWRFADWEQQHSWQKRLLGPFARAAGEPLFNPFDRASWIHMTGPVHRDPSSRDNGRVFRAVAAAVPDEDRIVLWQGDEIAWMSVAALAIASLATILIRLYGWRWGRAAGACAAAGLCLAAGVLTPVNAELAAAALTGLALSSLLPQKLLESARQVDVPADEMPTGSTQSFVPTAISVLAILANSAAPG